MENTYKVIFHVKNLGIYEKIPGLVKAMQDELIRVYNVYAEKCNDGVTDRLNEEFERLFPNYFKDNEGKEWYEMIKYNQFMSNGYQRLIVDELNEKNASLILDFFVDSEEVVFTGYLKADPNVTIKFSLKEV